MNKSDSSSLMITFAFDAKSIEGKDFLRKFDCMDEIFENLSIINDLITKSLKNDKDEASIALKEQILDLIPPAVFKN